MKKPLVINSTMTIDQVMEKLTNVMKPVDLGKINKAILVLEYEDNVVGSFQSGTIQVPEVLWMLELAKRNIVDGFIGLVKIDDFEGS